MGGYKKENKLKLLNKIFSISLPCIESKLM